MILNKNIKYFFTAFFITFTLLFPISVLVVANFAGVRQNPVKVVDASPKVKVPKEQDLNLLIMKSNKMEDDPDIFLVVNISAHDNKTSICSVPLDITTSYNTSSGNLKQLCGKYGVEGINKIIENMLGISIDRYIKVDDNSCLMTIDNLGGIDIDLKEEVSFENIKLPVGRQVLDGSRFCGVFNQNPAQALLALGSAIKNESDTQKIYSVVSKLGKSNFTAYDFEVHKSGFGQMVKSKETKATLIDLQWEQVENRHRLTSKSKEECSLAFSK